MIPDGAEASSRRVHLGLFGTRSVGESSGLFESPQVQPIDELYKKVKAAARLSEIVNPHNVQNSENPGFHVG